MSKKKKKDANSKQSSLNKAKEPDIQEVLDESAVRIFSQEHEDQLRIILGDTFPIGLEETFSIDLEDTFAISPQDMISAGIEKDSVNLVAPDIEVGENRESEVDEKRQGMVEDSTRQVTIEQRRLMLRASLANLPKEYSRCQEVLRDLNHAFRGELASVLTTLFNKHLQSMPHETYAEKQVLASWVNNELRQLGLAIRDPQSGKPAILVADVKGGPESPSRFRLEVRGDDGGRKRTLSTTRLPELELMEDELRQEPLSRHRPG